MCIDNVYILSNRPADEHGNSTEHEADLLVRKWGNGTPTEIKIGFAQGRCAFMNCENTVFTADKKPYLYVFF